MAYQVVDIQTLITEGKLVDITDINPLTAYVSIGYWQVGQRRYGDGANAYPQYAIPLQSIINAAPGTPISILNNGVLINNNILSIDFQGPITAVTNGLNPTQVIVTPTGGGGGGTVTAVSANNGLSVTGTVPAPIVQLGTNPLLFNTTLPQNTFHLSLTGTGKLGVGINVPTAPVPVAKLQVMASTVGSDRVAGTITGGNTLTVVNDGAPYTWVVGGLNYTVPAMTGTINVGDAVFINTDSGIVPGTYITAQTGPNTYTLSTVTNVNQTVYGPTVPSVPGYGGASLSTSPLVFKLQPQTGSTWDNGTTSTTSLEIWGNGAIKSGNLFISKQGSGGSKFSFGFPTSTNPFGPAGNANGSFAVLNTISTNTDISTGTASSTFSKIRFVGQNECQIVGMNDLALSYQSLTSLRGRNSFVGGVAISKNYEDNGNPINGKFPSIYYGADSSLAGNYGAQQGYSLCVYQPFIPGTVGSVGDYITGYIIGTTLYVTAVAGSGCNPMPAGLMTAGYTLSSSSGATSIIPGTTITGTLVPYVPGVVSGVPPSCPGAATVGQYSISTSQTYAAGPVGVTIYVSAYPNWNNSRAMYVDGTIKFKNLPQGSGSAPAGLTSGDIWVDTGANNVLKMVP